MYEDTEAERQEAIAMLQHGEPFLSYPVNDWMFAMFSDSHTGEQLAHAPINWLDAINEGYISTSWPVSAEYDTDSNEVISYNDQTTLQMALYTAEEEIYGKNTLDMIRKRTLYQ